MSDNFKLTEHVLKNFNQTTNKRIKTINTIYVSLKDA